MKPSSQRKATYALSVFYIVIGAIVALGTIIVISIVVELMQMLDMSSALEVGEDTVSAIEGEDISTDLQSSGISPTLMFQASFVFGILVIEGIIFIIAGVFGTLAARRPSKHKPFFICGVILTAISGAQLLITIIAYHTFAWQWLVALVVCVPSILLARCLKKIDDDRIAAGEEEEDPYDNDEYLGILRAIEVLFVINILFTLVALIYTSRNTVEYTFGNILDWANLVFECMTLWLIVRRYKAVRPFVLAFTAFNIISGVVYGVMSGTFSVHAQIFASAFDIFLFVYFLFSKRVRRICVNKFNFDGPKDPTAQNRGILDIKRLGWPLIRNLIMYYCVFSLLGHWMEAGMCQFIRLGLVEGEYDPTNTMLWRDWFYPFPMEGLAVVLIALFLYPLKNWLVKKIKIPVVPYVVSFVANMLVCVSIEFTMGLFVNADHQLWDYSDMAFNFMGQVCLQNALAFGAAASVIAWIVYPLLEKALSHVSNDAMNIAFVVCVAAYAIPQTLYLIDPPDSSDSGIMEDVFAEVVQAKPSVGVGAGLGGSGAGGLAS